MLSVLGCGCGGQVVAVPVPGIPGPPGPPGSGAATQVTATGTAGEALGGHRVVTRDAGGAFVYASSDNPAHAGLPLYLTTSAALAGAAVTVVAEGEVVEGSWSWTPGPLYLGVGGLLTQTPPTSPASAFLAQVGYAGTATRVYVDRETSVVLV